jgi:hypothetical protein
VPVRAPPTRSHFKRAGLNSTPSALKDLTRACTSPKTTLFSSSGRERIWTYAARQRPANPSQSWFSISSAHAGQAYQSMPAFSVGYSFETSGNAQKSQNDGRRFIWPPPSPHSATICGHPKFWLRGHAPPTADEGTKSARILCRASAKVNARIWCKRSSESPAVLCRQPVR